MLKIANLRGYFRNFQIFSIFFKTMKKRYFLQAGAAAVGTVVLSQYLQLTSSKTQTAASQSGISSASVPQSTSSKTLATTGGFEITKTEAQWRKLLTPAQFNVLREQGTEPAYSSALAEKVGVGTYACVGCNLPLFSSKTKFDSETGWPSFFAPLSNAVGTTEDHELLETRTEVHCRRCGGHLGHVFDDGPRPTGKRYCMNGVVLKFITS
jgi:peptide-methionine (R)-S-oxide reductase